MDDARLVLRPRGIRRDAAFMGRGGNETFIHGSVSFAGYKDVAIDAVSLSKAVGRH
jgi:hypothetical protein